MYTDLKYLMFLPLEQFSDKGWNKYNFRCPVCGDSQKSSTKKRGWAFEKDNELKIKCYNCGYFSSFQFFLKTYFYEFYFDYLKEKFTGSSFGSKTKNKSKDVFASEYEYLNISKVAELPVNHVAVKYLKDRLLPIGETYYTDNFAEWANKTFGKGTVNFQTNIDRRIVIPFYSRTKKIFALQGRTLDGVDPKYLTIKLNEDHPKIFGLDRVDFTKKIYVVEGPFDSLLLPNSLAMGGVLSDIHYLLQFTTKENIVIVPDNDFRNKQTLKHTEKCIEMGLNVVIWPSDFEHRDINDAILSGFSKSQILDTIEKNTAKGLSARVKLKLFRR